MAKKKKKLPSRSLADAWIQWEAQGLTEDEIDKRTELLGIDNDQIDVDMVNYEKGIAEGRIKKDPVSGKYPPRPEEKTRIRYSVSETVDHWFDVQGKSEPEVRALLFQRGIYNIGENSITDDDMDSPMPAPRMMTPADRELYKTYETDFNEGKYDNWVWNKKNPETAANRVTKNTVAKTGVDYDKVSAYVDIKTDRNISYGEGYPTELLKTTLPRLNPAEKALAEKLATARGSLQPWRGQATGAFVSGATRLAQLFGVERASSAEKGNVIDGVQDWVARGMEGLFTTKPSKLEEFGYKLQRKKIPDQGFPEAGRLLRETPAGKQLTKETMKRRKEALQELQDVIDPNGDEEAFPTNIKELEKIFGSPDSEGRITKKGYFDPKGNTEAKRLQKVIQNTLKVEKRLYTEKEFGDFGEWLDAAVPEPLRIDAGSVARQSRTALNKQFRDTVKMKPGNLSRIWNELGEMAEGLVGLTGYIAEPGRNMAINQLADLIAAGRMTKEEAQQIIDERGFQEGASLAPGILGYMEPLLNPSVDGYDTLKDQIRAEPVSFIISMLSAGVMLKGVKAAHAAHTVSRGKKLAKEFGFTDAQILTIVKEAEEVHKKTSTPVLRRWFDTIHGKHAANRFLGAMNTAKVPELVQAGVGAGMLGAAISPDIGGVAAMAGLGVGLKGTRMALVGSARAMNILEEVGAQTVPSGQVVSDNLLAETESGQKVKARVATEGEYFLERQQDGLDPQEILGEDAVNLAASTELAAKARAYVGTSPEVLEAKKLYDESPVGSAEKRLLRQEYLTTRDLALVRFIEGDGTPENPGVTLVKPSTQYQETIDALTEIKTQSTLRNEEVVRQLETQKEKLIEKDVVQTVEKDAASETTRLEKKVSSLRKKEDGAAANAADREELLNSRYQRRVQNLDEQLEKRRQSPAKGAKGVSRKDAVDVARKELADFDEKNKGTLPLLEEDLYLGWDIDKTQLKHLVDGQIEVEEYGQKVLKVPGRYSPEDGYYNTTTKTQRKRDLAAYNRIERFRAKRKKLEDKLTKAEDDLKDPGVKYNKRIDSYANVRRQMEAKHEQSLLETREKLEAESLDRQSQIKALEADIENVEDLRRQTTEQGDLPSDDDRPAWLKNAVSQEQLARSRRRLDESIERAREIEELGQRRLQLQIDSVARNKAAEYRRALQAFDGVHIEDGDYVQRLNVDVKFRADTGKFDQRSEKNIFYKDKEGKDQGPFDASEMRDLYAADKVDDNTVVTVGDSDPMPLSESFEINRPDQVRLSNGMMGDSENFSPTTGNTITRLLAFPGDQAESIVRALNAFVDKTFENIDGVIADGWKKGMRKKAATSGSKFLARTKKKPESDPLSYVVQWAKEQDKKDREALADNSVRRDNALSELWADDTIVSVFGGQLSDRGTNDLKRVMLDEYGDILVSQGTARMLTERDMRSRFLDYAKARLREAGVMPDISDLPDDQAKQIISQFENSLDMMIKDFAQGRTLDKFGSFGRTNYRITDPTGKPVKYTDASGNSVDATMENIFRDFIAGELSDQDIFRARQNALLDAAFYTANTYEGRAVIKEVLLDSTGGMTEKIWDLGPSNPEHQKVVFRFFLENGDLPPAVRIRELDDGTVTSDPLRNREAGAALEEVFNDPSVTNTNGLTLDELKLKISLAYSNGLADVDQGLQYVRLGSELDGSNIPGMQRIGERPVNRSSPGLAAQHAIVQPEHIKTPMKAVTPGAQTSDVYIRREMSDAIGWMLGTHADLELTGIFRFAQGINALFKWGKTAGSLLNPLTNFVSNNKTHLITQGRTPFVSVGDFVSTADMWSKYRAGELTGTDAGRRIELAIAQGFTEASDLIVEVDRTMRAMFANPGDAAYVEALGAIEDLYRGGKVPDWVPELLGGGKRVPGIRELTELQNRVYKRFGDELYKLTDGIMEMEKKEQLISNLPPGQGMQIRNLDSGAGFKDDPPIGTIVKLEDGYAAVYNSGSKRGKVFKSESLLEGEVGNLLAAGAMGHAASIYYNLGKVSRFMKKVRQLEAFVVQPFQSWRSKSLDIPMIKRGMFYRMFVDDIYTISTDPMTNVAIYKEALARHVRRQFWLAAVKDKQADDTAIRQFLPGWAKSAVISGTGANRQLLMADSSNPLGGIGFAVQFLAEIEDTLSAPSRRATNEDAFLANKQFWREFNRRVNRKEQSVVFLQEAVKEFMSGGAAAALILPLFGTNPRTGEPFQEGQENEWLTEVFRAVTPNYLDRIGVTHLATGGAAKTGIPYELSKALSAEFEYDKSLNGMKSVHTMNRSADNAITVFNVLLARRMRKVDPSYILQAILAVPEGTNLRINNILKEARKQGRTETNLLPEELNQISILRATGEAAKRHFRRASDALIGNGAKSPAQIDQIIRSKKAKSWSYQKEYREYLGKKQAEAKEKAKQKMLEERKEKMELRRTINQ